MWDRIILVVFLVLFFGPLLVMVPYGWHNKKQDYNVKTIRESIENINNPQIDEAVIAIAISSINRINGWNTLSAFYATMYYCFNLWGFLFAVFSLICAVNTFNVTTSDAQMWTAISAAITSITMCTQLFLRMDRKWRMFAHKHYKARIITNSFLCCIRKTRNPKMWITRYANTIVKLEESTRDDELL